MAILSVQSNYLDTNIVFQYDCADTLLQELVNTLIH